MYVCMYVCNYVRVNVCLCALYVVNKWISQLLLRLATQRTQAQTQTKFGLFYNQTSQLQKYTVACSCLYVSVCMHMSVFRSRDREINREIHRQRVSQTDRPKARQPGSQAARQPGSQADRQTDRERERERKWEAEEEERERDGQIDT